MWTMFMSHFANVHNQITFALDELKLGKEHPLRKIGTFGRRMWWAWLVPGFITGLIKNLGDLERTIKDTIAYPLGGVMLGRDIANMLIKGFGFGASPALGAISELEKTVKTKDVGKRIKHGVKALGIASGRVPTQAVDSVSGAIDFMTGETDDWLRLFFSEWVVSGSKGKSKSVI